MIEDQYILAVHGLLDEESAHSLLREIYSLARTGYVSVRLDAVSLGPVLPGGVVELCRGLGQLADDGPQIEIVRLSEAATTQFLLHGIPVDRHAATLWPPRKPAPASIVVCPGCGAQTRVYASGRYACPQCHTSFAAIERDGSAASGESPGPAALNMGV